MATLYSSWDSASYSWGTGKTRCRLVYSVNVDDPKNVVVTIGSDDYLSAVQCDSTYNMSQYGVKVTSGHKGGNGYEAKYNYSTGVMDGSTNWKGKVAKRSYTFKRKKSAYNITIYTSYVGQVVNGYGAMKNSGSVTKVITIPALKSYAVKFNANGGTGAPSAQTKYYDENLTLSSKVPTRTNYTFKGWATSETAKTATYKAGGTYTKNDTITLYAVWEMNYEKPTVSNIRAIRCNADGSESALGKYVKVSFDWTADAKLYNNNIAGLASYTVTCSQSYDDKTYSISKNVTDDKELAVSGTKSDIIIGGNLKLTENNVTTTKELNPIKDCIIKVQIKDGAGQSVSKKTTFKAEFYTPPVIANGKAIRANGDGSSNDEGVTGYVSFNWTVDKMAGANSVESITASYRSSSGETTTPITVNYTAGTTSGTVTANTAVSDSLTWDGVIDVLDVYKRSIVTIVEKETTDSSASGEDVGDGADTTIEYVETVKEILYYKVSNMVLDEGNLIGGKLTINGVGDINITQDIVDKSTNGSVALKYNDEIIAYFVANGNALGGISSGIYLSKTDSTYVSKIEYFESTLDIAESYVVTIVIKDKVSSTTENFFISRAFFTMDFKAGGKGIAMGKVADKDGFECDMKATFNNGLYENIPVIVTCDCNELTTSGKYYIGVSGKNKPDVLNKSGAIISPSPNGWLESKSYGDNYCHQTYTTYTGNTYARTMQAGKWNNWVSTYSTNQYGKLLWKNEKWLGTNSDGTNASFSLNESVLAQQHGIVLVFSWYDYESSKTKTQVEADCVKNYNFHSFFVPKGFVNSHRGYGSGFIMQGSNSLCYKRVYIYPTKIVGYKTNVDDSFSLNGHTINNKQFVLREIWGV